MPDQEEDLVRLLESASPCGCAEVSPLAGGDSGLLDQIPQVEELSGLLDQVSLESLGDGLELELAAAEMDLLAAGELGATTAAAADASLDQLLAIAGRYPGLKITLSY
jgi:hypothetical protein